MGFNKLSYLVTLYFLMYYLLMPSKYTKDLTNILEMLWNIEKDLNLASYSETEKKVYHVIAWHLSTYGNCNITDVIQNSGFSRSTVYKTIKKFEQANLVYIQQSQGCLLYTSPSPRDGLLSRMPSSA